MVRARKARGLAQHYRLPVRAAKRLYRVVVVTRHVITDAHEVQVGKACNRRAVPEVAKHRLPSKLDVWFDRVAVCWIGKGGNDCFRRRKRTPLRIIRVRVPLVPQQGGEALRRRPQRHNDLARTVLHQVVDRAPVTVMGIVHVTMCHSVELSRSRVAHLTAGLVRVGAAAA